MICATVKPRHADTFSATKTEFMNKVMQQFLVVKACYSGKNERDGLFTSITRLYCIAIFFSFDYPTRLFGIFLKNPFDFRCLRDVALTPVQPGRRRG